MMQLALSLPLCLLAPLLLAAPTPQVGGGPGSSGWLLDCAEQLLTTLPRQSIAFSTPSGQPDVPLARQLLEQGIEGDIDCPECTITVTPPVCVPAVESYGDIVVTPNPDGSHTYSFAAGLYSLACTPCAT